MTLTHNQLQALTWHACETRRTTPDCGPWDAPGTHKAISEICGTWTYNTAHDHVTAHARDPKARTPYAMRGSRPNLEAASSHKYPMRAGDPNECRTHRGQHVDHCSGCAADQKARPEVKTADDETVLRIARELSEKHKGLLDRLAKYETGRQEPS